MTYEPPKTIKEGIDALQEQYRRNGNNMAGMESLRSKADAIKADFSASVAHARTLIVDIDDQESAEAAADVLASPRPDAPDRHPDPHPMRGQEVTLLYDGELVHGVVEDWWDRCSRRAAAERHTQVYLHNDQGLGFLVYDSELQVTE